MIRVIRLHMNDEKGGLILAASYEKAILDEVEMFIGALGKGESLTLTAERMSKEELDALPEHLGW